MMAETNVAAENRAAAETTKKRRRSEAFRRRRFRKFLLVYTACGVLALAVGLFFFYRYMRAFELSRPENAMEAFMLSAGGDHWAELIGRSDAFETTVFEDGGAIMRRYQAAVDTAELTYRRSPGDHSEARPVFIVRAGERDIARVVFAPADFPRGYGFSLWEFESEELLASFLPSPRTVTVKAPPGASVALNGITLDEGCITGTVEYEGLSALEKAFVGVDKPYRNVYEVAGLLDNVEVAVTAADGAELAAIESDGSLFVYDLHSPAVYSVRITAPAAAQVFVNGAPLDAAYVTESRVNALMEGMAAYAPGLDEAALPGVSVYDIGGLFCPVETVTAVSESGASLECVSDAADAARGAYEFGFESSAGLAAGETALAEDFITAYARFAANVNQAGSRNWSAVKKYLLRGSEAYDRLNASRSGLEWRNSRSVTVDSVECVNFVAYGDGCFTCRVRFSITVRTTRAEEVNDGVFDLVFVRSGGEWLLARMTAV